MMISSHLFDDHHFNLVIAPSSFYVHLTKLDFHVSQIEDDARNHNKRQNNGGKNSSQINSTADICTNQSCKLHKIGG